MPTRAKIDLAILALVLSEEFYKVRPRAFSAQVHRKVVSLGKQISLV